MGRRALLIAAMVLSLAAGFHVAGDHLRARVPDASPRPALLTQGIASEAAVLPPRVEVELTERSPVSPGLTLSPASGARPSALRERVLAGTGPGDDARQLHRRARAGLRAPPR